MPLRFALNLAFSSHGFYNHHHKDDGDASELPLAFSPIIPTSQHTGKIATQHNGYDVIDGLPLQVATKASNVWKKYLNGKYDDNSDKYFGGVDELLGNLLHICNFKWSLH
ncbi:hypothetical protein MJO28_014411 [Puccinia striiformis f. sp. tritici]|uniref:Uncharacterized protein n=1 Tax=Puccinia striiformis f. sp. tritici TaxID=168172 RepID=A0ACC0DTN8_9BASI|nr:hypothetical protein Pst134EA_026861 [Puccinia striiformis f. sp. tritici]KAH9443071.1 hypothetical protein Pst134EB_027424 [Puccinia striiformis f. sp. tritici]KAH9450152.1 hypothetical protein Pst134EA_026861 [Puccinia striiformis f. sp. tritici]KAI7938832.1 hypothetical protein MJO28_014411 [Puccinia striiformis f. sp. tritici]